MDPFDLYLITDRKAVADENLVPAVAEALAGGVRLVQLREKDLADHDLLQLATALRRLTASCGARLLINGRVDIALACHADGVHLGMTSPSWQQARQQLGPDKLIGFSTHNRAEVAAAETAGADFITFGPVYPTPSKLAYGPPIGLAALEQICAATNLPVYPLGGIKHEHLAELRTAGATGFACIRAILSAPSPRQAAAEMLATWQS
jgi:thiamine-phosphate pyrophosphorylase